MLWEIDVVQSLIAGVGTYLLFPFMGGEMPEKYEFFGDHVKQRIIAGLELSAADLAGQFIAMGPMNYISGVREPINALSASVIYGLERKSFHKHKSFIKSMIGGLVLDSAAIVLTEPLTKIIPREYNPNKYVKNSNNYIKNPRTPTSTVQYDTIVDQQTIPNVNAQARRPTQLRRKPQKKMN
jgi:hypothetical protein